VIHAVPPAFRRRAGATVGVVACALLAASCSSGSTAVPTPTTAPRPTTTTTAPEQTGWTTLSRDAQGIAIDTRTLTEPDGTVMTVVRFLAGHVDYDLHIGSQDPPTGAAVIGPNSGPAISPTEQPDVLACFNGGFKLRDKPGGIVTWGQVLSPVVPGFASFVTDAAGNGSIRVWGQGVPTPSDPALNVRQNLAPLIDQGKVSPTVNDTAAWGYPLGGNPRVPRSALGQDSSGNLVYVAGMAALPADLAGALAAVGVVTAMQLDINPSTIQMDTATSPGGTLVAQVAGQQRPANQCQVGWIRDFVVVLAKPSTTSTGPVAHPSS
jgi:hypothetical protein